MLENILLQADEDTPYISLNTNGKCTFEGKSYPEDIASFYIPIINWFENYVEFGRNDLVLDMKMSYFNSASSKILIDIFERIDEIKNQSVTVNWYYPEIDEEIFESGKIYQGLTKLHFNFISF